MDGGRGEGGVEEDWRDGADGEIVKQLLLGISLEIKLSKFLFEQKRWIFF